MDEWSINGFTINFKLFQTVIPTSTRSSKSINQVFCNKSSDGRIDLFETENVYFFFNNLCGNEDYEQLIALFVVFLKCDNVEKTENITRVSQS